MKSDDDRLMELLTGVSSLGGVAFAKPFDVAVHRGRVFVSDTVSRVVHAMDFQSGKSYAIGDTDDLGRLYKPLGLALDRNGNLYVVDITAKAILVYDRDGKHLRTLGDKGLWDRPSGIDVSPDGSRIFVVDTGGVDSDRHRLILLDAMSGETIRTIGMRGSGPGELNLPRDVKLAANGLLYVTDGGNFRVSVFDQDGNFIRNWGKPGRRLGQFSRPKGISSDTEGNIYVADAAFGNFQIFDAEGQLLLFVGSRSTTPGPAKYMLPAGIDVDEDGRVYFVDQFFRKVDVYRPATLAENEGYLGRGGGEATQEASGR